MGDLILAWDRSVPDRYVLLVRRTLELSFSTEEQSNSIGHLGHICGNISGLLLWFAWLRCGHINKLAATVFGVGTLGVVVMDRGILRSVRERARQVQDLSPNIPEQKVSDSQENAIPAADIRVTDR